MTRESQRSLQLSHTRDSAAVRISRRGFLGGVSLIGIGAASGATVFFAPMSGTGIPSALSRFQRGGQRMLSVIPSHSLVRDADHGGQIPCCRKRRAAA